MDKVNGSSGGENLSDGAGSGSEEVAGVSDGTEAAGGSESSDGVVDQGNISGSDGVGEGGETGEIGGEDEGAFGEKGESSHLTAEQIDALVEKRLNDRLEAEKAQREGAQGPRQLTEEEWSAKEEEWGGASRKTIQAVASMQMTLYKTVMDAINQRFGKFERQDSIAALGKEKGFSDVATLRPGIEEFLKDFPENMHSNPALLKKAAIYARGLGVSGRVAKVRNEGEKNRRIVGAGRPAPANNGARRNGSVTLTPAQRQAARLHPGGEEGYKKDLASRGKPMF